MIVAKIVLCADGVVRDVESNRMSIFNLIEGIQAAFPLFIPRMDVFALLERAPDDPTQQEITFRLSIDATEIVSTPMTIDFLHGRRNRSTLHVNGLVLPHPGVFRASVIVDDSERGTYEVTLEQVKGPQLELEQAPGELSTDA